jgi:hypothetical protein
MAFAGRGGGSGGGGGGGEEGFEMVCMEEVRGHQRVYLRRADSAGRAATDTDDWLIIDDHVRRTIKSLIFSNRPSSARMASCRTKPNDIYMKRPQPHRQPLQAMPLQTGVFTGCNS